MGLARQKNGYFQWKCMMWLIMRCIEMKTVRPNANKNIPDCANARCRTADDPVQPTTSSDESDSGSGSEGEGTDDSSPPIPKDVLPAKPSPPPSRRTSIVSVPAAPVRRAPIPPPPPEDEQWIMTYNCAAGCSELILIRRGEVLRCHTCRYRILCKQRTKRMVQFEVR